MVALRSLFLSNKWQQGSRSGGNGYGGEEELGGEEGGETMIRYTVFEKNLSSIKEK